MMRRAGERLVAVLVLALGLRLLYLFIRYVLGFGTQRFHVESATVVFLVVGLTYRLIQSRRFAEADLTTVAGVGAWLWPVFCGLSVALYWLPASSFGVLSAALVRDGAGWNVGADTPPGFRSLPVLIWGLLLQLGGGTTTLYLLNLLLHGSNAYLTTKVIGGWVQDRVCSLLGGLLVFAAPLAIASVPSLLGVFDLLATTLVLACILIARRYEDHPALTTRICFVTAGIAAFASKETAAIAAGLVLVDAWIRNAKSRPLLVDTGILILVVGAVSLMHLGIAFGLGRRPPLTKFVLQLVFFRSFGELAVPWHVDTIQRHPWLPILGVVALVCLLTSFFLAPIASRRRTKLAVGACVWVLLCIAPVFSIVFTDPEAQQSRYLHLAVIGWAGLIAALASDQWRGHFRSLSLAVMLALVATHIGYAAEGVRTERRVRLGRIDLFEAIKPVRLANCDFRRYGEPNDGGYLLCGNLLSSVQSSYSYGISGYDQWGCDVSRDLSVPTHQYDCFNLMRPVCTGGRTVFHEECIGGERAIVEGRLFESLENQFAKNGDDGKQVVVKMDVEGAEWESLQRAPDAVLQQIDQLTIELHGVSDERVLPAVVRLKQFFHIANVHFNNFSCVKGIEPFPAEVYEVLFVNKRLAVLDASGVAGAPPALTPPNIPQWPDCQTVAR